LPHPASLVEKPYGHLLIHVGAVQSFAEVLERDLALAAQVRLQDRPLRNADQLVLANVRPDHHVQDGEQLVSADHTIVIQIVHLEGELQLLLPAVELTLLVIPQRPEVGQDVHELPEVHPIVVALSEKGMNYPLAQRINGQFRDTHQILPGQGSAIIAIQGGEARVKSLDLVGGDWKIKLIKINQSIISFELNTIKIVLKHVHSTVNTYMILTLISDLTVRQVKSFNKVVFVERHCSDKLLLPWKTRTIPIYEQCGHESKPVRN